MKLIIKGLVIASLFTVSAMATESKKEVERAAEVKIEKSAQDIQIFTSANADGKITPKTIEAAFEKAGFFVSENRDMNFPFKIQFKETSYDTYNLFTFYNKEAILALVKEYPQIGMFAPLSMSIYMRKGDTKISVSSLTPAAIAKILKIPADNASLVKSGKMLKEALKAAMPEGKFETLSYTVQKPTGALVTSYTMEMDPEEWEDEKEEFQMEFEGTLSPNGFVMAGFNDLNHDFKESKYEVYDFYDVYSICKLPVIYTVAKVRPEAGAFAPCSLHMYKKKGENTMHIAFPSTYNWISSMAIDDKESLKVLEEAQASMNKIIASLIE